MVWLLACHKTAPAATEGGDGARYGTVNFPISCSADAQQRFNRAVAMLHSFFYPETVKAFGAIAQMEPTCAMAYWGIAVSQRPNPLAPPFAPILLQRGWEAIEHARSAGPKTARERDWIEALALFFKDYETIDQKTRALAYEHAMEQLSVRYPDDTEAAVFYALALDETADLNDSGFANQLKAGAILEKVWAQHPDHPGAIHYLIHSYDYAPLAARALAAARKYADLAPAAPHARHMPSHIFAQLGMWQDVIRSENAVDAAINTYVLEHERGTSLARVWGRYHSLDFLTTAYLQLAQDQRAKQIVDQRNSVGEIPAASHYGVHTAFAAIPVRYAFDRSAWAEAASLAVPKTPYPQAEAITWFARAIGAARTDDPAAARTDLTHLDELHAALVKANDAYWAVQVDIERKAAIAWIAVSEDHYEAGISAMRGAADLEDQSQKHIAMENRLSPMHEMFGELLLATNHAADALQEFQRSLRSAPNRYRSFAGAATAAEQLDDKETAKKYYAKLLSLCANADSDRPELTVARDVLGHN